MRAVSQAPEPLTPLSRKLADRCLAGAGIADADVAECRYCSVCVCVEGHAPADKPDVSHEGCLRLAATPSAASAWHFVLL